MLLSQLVVFWLISPDSVTCSLALHKHMVSDVVKWLSTFASLALSNLAPIFVFKFFNYLAAFIAFLRLECVL